jgi:hypothetical protein
MAPIPFPVTTVPGHRSQESAGRLINCFAEPIGEGSKDAPPPSKRVRVPGMTSFLTSSQSGFRGMALLAGANPLYAAFDGFLYKGNSAGGALANHAVLSGSLPVYFARNNRITAGGPDKVIVTTDGTPGAYVITDPSGITDYNTASGSTLPQPNGVCSIDGYIVFTIGDGRIFATGLNVLTVNSLSVGTADVRTDPPVRPIPYSGRLLIFGTQTLEFWNDVGSTPFPFQRATTVPYGLTGPDAVAGWEDGFGAGLLWVANDYTVRQLDGYTPVRVSVPDLERLIQRDTNKSRMLANVYVVDGHPMWTITGETFSWSYDLSTRKWHERASYLTNRWRGLQTVNAFDRWLVGDRGQPNLIPVPLTPYINSGNIYNIDPTNHLEGTDLLPLRVESGPVMQFPERVRVARADFHVEVGVGIATSMNPSRIDPVAMISWSDDGGLNWSVPFHRRLGKQADYTNLSLYRTGMSTRIGRRWRFDISDPVYVALFGGEQSTELRQG